MGKATFVNVPTDATVLDFTVADGTAISKGSLMFLSGTRTAINLGPATGGVDGLGNNAFVGILESDKEANDGQTEMGCIQEGIFDVSCALGNPPGEGQMVSVSGADTVRLMPIGIQTSGGSIVGQSLETATGNTQVEIRITPGNAGGTAA